MSDKAREDRDVTPVMEEVERQSEALADQLRGSDDDKGVWNAYWDRPDQEGPLPPSPWIDRPFSPEGADLLGVAFERLINQGHERRDAPGAGNHQEGGGS